MSKRTVLIGLLAHFSLWWLASAWLWTRGFGWKLWILLCPIAPPLSGPFYLKSAALWAIGVASILSSAGLAISAYYSLTKRRPGILLVAHLAILVYWLVGIALIAAQT